MSMSKTSKKLKSVDCDNIDLTFNEIYDVFIDSEEYEFIIDDVGDKRYVYVHDKDCAYRDWETDRKSTRLNSSHITRSRMPSSA